MHVINRRSSDVKPSARRSSTALPAAQMPSALASAMCLRVRFSNSTLRKTPIRMSRSLLRMPLAAASRRESHRSTREREASLSLSRPQWDEHRTEMLQCTDVHRNNLSFYLGGKSPSDDKNWSPDMQAVRATIRFAIATGRLDAGQQKNGTG